MVTQENRVEIQTSAQWKLIGRSMTAPSPVFSPSSILPSLSYRCAFIISKEKFSACIKMSFKYLFSSFRITLNLILR